MVRISREPFEAVIQPKYNDEKVSNRYPHQGILEKTLYFRTIGDVFVVDNHEQTLIWILLLDKVKLFLNLTCLMWIDL